MVSGQRIPCSINAVRSLLACGTGSGGNPEIHHHAAVFMFEIVAVEHVDLIAEVAVKPLLIARCVQRREKSS